MKGNAKDKNMKMTQFLSLTSVYEYSCCKREQQSGPMADLMAETSLLGAFFS